MMASLMNTLTNYSLRKNIFKDEIKTAKGHEKILFFFPPYFELCLMFHKVKIVYFRLSRTAMRIPDPDPKHWISLSVLENSAIRIVPSNMKKTYRS